MKKVLILSFAFCFQTAFSQVSIEKNKLVKDGQAYKMSEYKNVFSNQESLRLFKKAKSKGTVSQIIGGIGGGLMGFGLAKAISGGTESKVTTNSGVQTIKHDKSGAWTVFGIGVGIVGIAIPFAVSANKDAEKALKLENGESTAFQPYFKFETAGNGLALSYNF